MLRQSVVFMTGLRFHARSKDISSGKAGLSVWGIKLTNIVMYCVLSNWKYFISHDVTFIRNGRIGKPL